MRLVGGCVRDFILGVEPHDIDIATPFKPEDARVILKKSRIRSVPTSLPHGVITAGIEGRHYEITTLRMDRGRGAKWIDSYEADAQRRDFTINAMSMDKDGVIYDYLGGRDDLANRVVRFIGDPAVRIQEDPIRIYRYVRFWALFGGDKPDAAVMAAAKQHAGGLNGVSRERRRKEILKILMTPRVIPALEALEEANALKYILPTARVDSLKRFLEINPEADVWERLAVVSYGNGLNGVHLTEEEEERLASLQRVVVYRDRRALKLMRGDEGEEVYRFFLTRGWVWGDLSDDQYQELSALEVPRLPVQESDLAGRPGMKKARSRAEAMNIIKRIWVDLDFPADKDVLWDAYATYMVSIGKAV